MTKEIRIISNLNAVYMELKKGNLMELMRFSNNSRDTTINIMCAQVEAYGLAPVRKSLELAAEIIHLGVEKMENVFREELKRKVL